MPFQNSAYICLDFSETPHLAFRWCSAQEEKVFPYWIENSCKLKFVAKIGHRPKLWKLELGELPITSGKPTSSFFILKDGWTSGQV